MFNSILVVCVGNICRSPTGERLLKSALPDKKISSAGLGALVGRGADEQACHVAEAHGTRLDGHIARQVNANMCRENDLILVMEKEHIEAICRISPEVRGKVMLFGHWNQQKEIPDPYKKSQEAFEFVYNLLDDSTKKWVKALGC